MPKYRTTAEDFWNRVEKGPTCWNWLGPVSHNGMGWAYLDGYRENAHRIAYRLTVDPHLEEGRYVRRTCENQLCVNPKHLIAAPSEEDKQRIVEEYLAGGVTQKELAERWGIWRHTVSRLVTRHREQHGIERCG